MRSDNLQLPCVQPLTSSYNFPFPHGHHGHVCHGGCGGPDGRGGRGEHVGQDRTGQSQYRSRMKFLVSSLSVQRCVSTWCIEVHNILLSR